MLFGAGAGQGSIKLWCREHRAHHRYVDTDQDPYSVQKGLFYSHIGWIIFKDDPDKIGRVNVEDLKRDSIVTFQANYYWQLFLLMAYIGPTLIAGFGWGDWLGGYIYGGLMGTALVQQSTFCINSLAHWMGDQPYGSFKSARNCFIVAILTLGEGYHNFHHEFPLSAARLPKQDAHCIAVGNRSHDIETAISVKVAHCNILRPAPNGKCGLRLKAPRSRTEQDAHCIVGEV